MARRTFMPSSPMTMGSVSDASVSPGCCGRRVVSRHGGVTHKRESPEYLGRFKSEQSAKFF